MAGVPCLRPWDVKHGHLFDVLTQGNIILSLILSSIIVCMHFGTPCQSMTWARWPQLRSREFPAGIPGLGAKQHALVETGNALLSFTVCCCFALTEMHAYFSVENPELSWLWVQHDMDMLLRMEGVALVRFLFKQFAVPFVKPTLIAHNMPTLHMLRDSTFLWSGT